MTATKGLSHDPSAYEWVALAASSITPRTPGRGPSRPSASRSEPTG